ALNGSSPRNTPALKASATIMTTPNRLRLVAQFLLIHRHHVLLPTAQRTRDHPLHHSTGGAGSLVPGGRGHSPRSSLQILLRSCAGGIGQWRSGVRLCEGGDAPVGAVSNELDHDLLAT